MGGGGVLGAAWMAGALTALERTHGVDAREADVILSLDWVDMVNLFRRVWPDGSVPPKVIQISADRLVHKGWTRDHMGLPVADIDLLAEPCATVPMLLDEVRQIDATADRADAVIHIDVSMAADVGSRQQGHRVVGAA